MEKSFTIRYRRNDRDNVSFNFKISLEDEGLIEGRDYLIEIVGNHRFGKAIFSPASPDALTKMENVRSRFYRGNVEPAK